MRSMSATDLARNFSRVLDQLERGGEEIVITRNHHPVAKIIPGAPRQTALEAFADLFGVIPDAEGAAWLADSKGADRKVAEEMHDPWA